MTVRAMALGFGICLLPQRAYKTVNNYIIIAITNNYKHRSFGEDTECVRLLKLLKNVSF